MVNYNKCAMGQIIENSERIRFELQYRLFLYEIDS
jgi:hypothetical protein